ncbi:hypothetical protein SJ05684_b59920 (plasmid) [Sinorhizobium sojae CCBAU 05684]|uniref:DUF2380 domain-containing protein n=1 Tax=Sinorhizobium sojae CCBAU 05684 TaxID=716928 RepID=A0A249PMT0_9HYPH|nr:DUF2380 domain-containing protein [Sinorhizobium sojae]ASY66974.1 hypothetical protein SJ05684_b59920 [Sinorhizobium sojae CCBAU 05684]
MNIRPGFHSAVRAIFSALLGASALASVAAAETVEPLAVASFDFRDTSGEVANQMAEHEARLTAFMLTVREKLAENRKITLTSLACEHEQCTARKLGIAELSKQAKSAGASHLLIGEVHKMSTLVGWVKYALLDLNSNKPTCDRFLTYRGDTDEAWQRAARFVARDVERSCIP